MFSQFKIRFSNREDFDAALNILKLNNNDDSCDIGYGDCIISFFDGKDKFEAEEKLIKEKISFHCD